MKLVLASSSSYRREQLQNRLGLTVDCTPPLVDEVPLAGESPEAVALRLSQLKAASVAEHHHQCIIIAGDQTAALGDTLLRKPGNVDAARAQLRAFSGQTLFFYSGVWISAPTLGFSRGMVVRTRVRFRQLQPTQIDHYLALDRPWDCVGAFKNEGRGIALFEAIHSDDPSALTGLPLIATTTLLAECGVDVLSIQGEPRQL